MRTKKTTTPDLTNSALENCRIDASPDRGFIRKRLLLAVFLIGASFTVFLWGAGAISYRDSARSTPPKVTANAQFYPTFGTPNDALVTDDDAYCTCVSVTWGHHTVSRKAHSTTDYFHHGCSGFQQS